MNADELGNSLVNLLMVAKNVEVESEDLPAEVFLERVDIYLASLGTWKAALSAEDERRLRDDDELRETFSELISLHQHISEQANDRKDRVQEELNHVGKRAQVLRAYVDRFPKRVTIAGKREG